MRSLVFVVSGVLLSTLSCGGGAKPFGWQPTSLDRLTHSPKTTAIYFGDPLPYLHRIAASPRLERELVDGRFGKAMRYLGNRPKSPREIVAALQSNKDWIPLQAAIVVGDRFWRRIDSLGHTFFYVALATVAREAGDASVQMIPQIQKNLLDTLNKTRVPPLVVWARLRSPEASRAMLEAIGRFFHSVQGDQVHVQRQPNRLRVEIGANMPQEQLRMALTTMGIISGDNDQYAKPLAKTLDSFRAQITVTQTAERLLFEFGDARDTTKPFREEDLELTLVNSPQSAAAIAWNISELQRAARHWEPTLDKWLGTPAGKALVQADDENLLGDWRDYARRLPRALASGRSIVDIDDAGLRSTYLAYHVKPVRPIGTTTIPRFVPNDVAIVSITNIDSLGTLLRDLIEQFESRVAIRSFREGFNGTDLPENNRFSQISHVYYKHFGRFRQLIYEQAQKTFQPPLAVVWSLTGVVGKMKLADRRDTAQLSNLPVPEIAFIGRLRQPQKDRRFLETVFKELMTAGFGSSSSTQFVWTEDLGLGVPTRVFSMAWIQTVLNGRVQFPEKGDLRPHYFSLPPYTVFSTSPKLSRRIVAVHKRTNQISKLNSVTSYAHLKPGALSQIFVMLEQWGNKLELGRGFFLLTGGVADLLRPVRMKAWTFDRGTTRQGFFQLTTTPQH